MARLGLTYKQKQCLDFITRYSEQHGVAPSYAEMAKALNVVSNGNIARIMTALKERGYIRIRRHLARSVVVISDDDYERMMSAQSFSLPPTVRAALVQHCMDCGNDPADVVADAVALHLDVVGQSRRPS